MLTRRKNLRLVLQISATQIQFKQYHVWLNLPWPEKEASLLRLFVNPRWLPRLHIAPNPVAQINSQAPAQASCQHLVVPTPNSRHYPRLLHRLPNRCCRGPPLLPTNNFLTVFWSYSDTIAVSSYCFFKCLTNKYISFIPMCLTDSTDTCLTVKWNIII